MPTTGRHRRRPPRHRVYLHVLRGKTPQRLDELVGAIGDIPEHRVVAPSAAMWSEAGLLAGLRARLAGFSKGQQQENLNDALILLQARAEGAVVLTENLSDFDPLQQLAPDARVLFYRATA